VAARGEVRWPPPGKADGRRRVVVACPQGWDCAGFAGGVSVPRTTGALARPWARPVLPGAAAPRSQAVRRLRPGHARHGRACYWRSSTRPWCFTPSVASTSGSLDIRGLWPLDGVLKRALGRLLRPTHFLPDLGGACQATVVCIANLTAGGLRGNDLNAARVWLQPVLSGKRGIDGCGRFGREARFR